jgi:hypothetical protein
MVGMQPKPSTESGCRRTLAIGAAKGFHIVALRWCAGVDGTVGAACVRVFRGIEKPLEVTPSHHPDGERDQRGARERHGPFERIETKEAGHIHGLSPCFSFVSSCPQLFRHLTG